MAVDPFILSPLSRGSFLRAYLGRRRARGLSCAPAYTSRSLYFCNLKHVSGRSPDKVDIFQFIFWAVSRPAEQRTPPRRAVAPATTPTRTKAGGTEHLLLRS
jgi:hypothetical protein